MIRVRKVAKLNPKITVLASGPQKITLSPPINTLGSHSRVKDNHIQSWVNGVMVGDVYDDLTGNGYIALQLHGIGKKKFKSNKKIRWKNLHLKELQ